MELKFIEARWYTKTSGRRIDYIVIHDMEAPEKGETAENIARYFATTDTKASAHYNVDNNSIVQSVREQDIAYHAPPNLHSIGVEHAGYARQSREEWLDAYGQDMLRLSARLVAELVLKYNLPVQWLSPDELRAGKRGITSHRNVSKAFGQSSHTDPGPDFPIGWYMDRVREAINTEPEEPVADYSEAQMINFARVAVQAELGDENVGAFSDRVAEKAAAKVLAALPAPAAVEVDVDALAAAVAARLLPLQVVKG